MGTDVKTRDGKWTPSTRSPHKVSSRFVGRAKAARDAVEGRILPMHSPLFAESE